MTNRQILETMYTRYFGERKTKVMNLDILLSSKTSIPEHTDFATAVDEVIVQIAELDDKLDVINKLMKEDFKNV